MDNRCDMLVAMAAVVDHAPAESRATKIRNGQRLTLKFELTEHILAKVAPRPKPSFCVGFAAKTAEAKPRRKKVPLPIANRAQDAMGWDENEVTLLDESGAHLLARTNKLALARPLVAEIA
ncbi:MAG: hypothetical protein C5B46_02990 [Proteobacteria bacterium]|nr:MAG: hypothetical protein C5B46_02990 [Pseudomonadota bacterium]